nr:MAG TPA: endosialidase chaperone [Caudoviricetes sp.]
MSKTYNYQVKKVAATPRNQRLTDGIQAAAATGGAVYTADSAPQYWELVTVDANGNALEEAGYYLRPVQGKHIVVPGDVTANATEDDINSLPVAADYTTTGLFRAKQGGGLLYDTKTNGWYVNPDFAGGGVNFTVGDGLQMSVDNKLSVKYGTIAGTACQGNDYRLSNDRKNPYKLSWNGGEYDGSAEKTLPDFITDNNGNIKKLYGSGDNKKYLSGDGTFYSVQYDEISGLEDNYVTIGTAQTVTGAKKFTSVTHIGPVNNVHILLGKGAGNCINGVDSAGNVKNLYLNYGSTKYTLVDEDNNVITGGDVVANSTTNTITGVVPVADNTTYGLVKYDNLTIKKNSSGQLYCTVQGGGSSGVVKYWRPSVNTSGVLSWTLSESESTPSSVNIKGPKGDTGATGAKGQGVTYQWYGTQLRLGTIDSGGNVSWGSYVDLKGPKGDQGPAGSGGGSTSNCVTLTGEQTITGKKWFNNLNTTFGALHTKLIVGTGNGNVINAKDNSGNYLNIQFNWRSDKLKTYIDSNNNIYTSGNVLSNQNFSDRRLKTLLCKNENILDKIQYIDVYDYTRVDDENKVLKTGVIAQDVKKAFPALVMLDTLDESPTAGYYAVNHATLGAVVAIGGCKELYAKYKEQQQTIDDLQSKLALLMQEVEKMKGGAV